MAPWGKLHPQKERAQLDALLLHPLGRDCFTRWAATSPFTITLAVRSFLPPARTMRAA